jgi:hypothetical protein
MGPLTGGAYYQIYRPLPWRIKVNTWHETGNLEVVLVKRRIDKSFQVDPTYLAKIK